MVKKTIGAAAIAAAALLAAALPARADTLETVRERGVLACGLGEESGYARRGADGRMSGLRVDLCRAVAAVVLDDPEAVSYIPLFASARLDALRNREVDVLFGGTTWTLGREAQLGAAFTGVTFYDGQGFVAGRDRGWSTLADVPDGVRVCVVAATTTIDNLKDWMAATGRALRLVEAATADGAWNAFLTRDCDLLTNDRSGLAMALRDRAPDPDDYVVLPDMISREPLSPAVRKDDPRWETLVRFTVNALILAEAKGITQAVAGDPDPAVVTDAEARRLLGLTPGVGAPLGLDDAWARRAIAAAGNYGEIYEANLGGGSPYGMTRGLNALWTDGGLLYPLPIR